MTETEKHPGSNGALGTEENGNASISYIVSEYNFEKFMMMVILGSTGDAMDIKMNFFFTFWGLFNLKNFLRSTGVAMTIESAGVLLMLLCSSLICVLP